MAELEKEQECDNCGSKYRLLYDEDQVSYDPENCPFCGDLVNISEGIEVEESDWDEEIEYESDDWKEE